jgi:penicillin-binding protein 1A
MEKKKKKEREEKVKKRVIKDIKAKTDKSKKIIEEDDDILLLDDLKEEDMVKKVSKSQKKKMIKKKVKEKKKKNGKKKRAWWKKLLSLFIILFALGIFAIGGFLAYIIVTTSDFDPEALESQEQTIIYSADGTEIAQLGYELREKVTYDELPQVLIDAIVATEDSRFFQHNGVDFPRFLKATIGQLMGNSSAGGASTLTMQVVKNNLTSTEKSIIRKFKDMYLATFYMERQYSKEEIFEFYVNDSSLGSNVYGVGEAAEYYFGKSVSELSLPEAALIAGLYQAPNGYNPYYYPEKANERIKTVLKLMVRHGYITQEEADAAGSIDISSLLVGLADSDNAYQGYIDTVITEVEDKTGDNPYLVSMKIYTALDTSIQDGINDAFNGKNYTWENDKVQAGVTVVDCNTGEIVAVGTGRKENSDALTWNYATKETRQPGSTAKPIFAYGPAFEYLNYSPGTLLVDEEWSYTDGTSIGNWDGNYKGLMNVRDALAISRNIPALKAFQQVNAAVGNKKIVEFVENLGIDINGVAYESYSIGGLETGVTTLQMAGAYAAFANGGYYNTPHTVTKIEYRDTGETVEYSGENNKVMSESTAYLMNNALEYAANNGFSGGAKVSGSHVAVKTGTTNFSEETRELYNYPDNAENDLWTVAYTKNYSIALWYGYPTAKDGYNTSNYWKESLMSTIMKYIPKETTGWSVPSSVKAVQIEKETWPIQLASEYTPSSLVTTEYFKSGTEPTDVSERFSKLDDVTDLDATSSNGSVTLTWKSETPKVITEDYLNTYFSQSQFGNSSDSLKKARLAYNSSTLGGYGYGIYLKDSSGNLTRVGWTADKTYTYTPSGSSKSVTLVVKAEYKNFKDNASEGVSTNVTVTGSSSSNSSATTGDLKLITGESSITLNAGEANSSYFSYTVIYGGVDVTDDATVTITLSGNGQSTTCQSVEQLVREVKQLSSGSYTINYTALYIGESIKAKQSLTIK